MKKITESIKFGGGSITFIRMKMIVRGVRCMFCGKKIKEGQKMWVVIPNKQQFPNSRVHDKCTRPTPPFDTNNPLVWAAGELSKSWKTAQAYKHWFVD